MDNQPGLEVTHHEADIQVAYPHQQWLYPVQGGQEEHKEVVPQAGTIPVTGEPQAAAIAGESNSPPRKIITKKTILITIACLLVVVGVVVGAVLGTQSSRSSSPTTTAAPSPSSQPESGSGQENRTSISSPAEMTGSPTSVSPGLAPTAISWGHPHLEIYALTNNNTNSIYRKYRNANATGEGEFEPEGYDMELIGSNIDASSAPSIAVNERRENPTTNQTEVFINAEGSCYNNWHIDNQLWIWWGPCFLGLSVVGAPVVVKYNASVTLVQVFSLGAADTRLAVYYTRWRARQDEYSDPAQIPGPDLQDMKPAVVAWNGDDTRVDIFVVARADNHLLHAWWSAGSWSEYEDLQGFVTTPPVVASRAPGILDVFIRGGDAGLWHISYNGTWTGWTRISSDSRIRGQPDAVAATRSIVDVFAWREDGCLLHKSFDGNSGRWTPEHDFEVLASGELISSPPNVVSDGEGSIHVFAYRNQDELIWIRLNSGSVGEGTYMTTLASVPYL